MELQEDQNKKNAIRQSDFSFEFKKFEGPGQIYIETVFCDICFHFKEKDDHDDQTLKMLTCYGCGQSVHLHCHGVSTPFNEEKTSDNYTINMFICDKCKEVSPLVEENCILCNRQSGILKRINLNWIHPCCALFSQNIELSDIQNNSFNEINLGSKNKKKTISNQFCEFCKGNQGGLYKCQDLECQKFTHISCVLFHKTQLRLEGQDLADINWNIRILMEKNTNYNKILAKGLISGKEELKNVILSIFKDYKACEVTEDHQTRYNTKKNKKNEEFEAFIEEIEKKIESELSQISTRKKEIKDQKDIELDFSTLRGATIRIECLEHKTLEIYCKCIPPIYSENMICCDYCENWFHLDCVGLKSVEDCEKLAFFFCSLCREWRKFKAKLIKEQEKKNQISLISEVFPKEPNRERFRLQDYLYIYKILLSRIDLIINSPKMTINIDNFMKFLCENLSLIPFKFPSKFENIRIEKYKKIAVDFLIENKFEKFLEEIQVKSGLNAETKLIDSQNISKNNQNKKSFEKFIDFFRSKGLNINVEGLISNHKKIKLLFWLDKYHETLMSAFKKPEFDDLLLMQSEALQLDLSGSEYLEIDVLNEKIKEYSSRIMSLESKYFNFSQLKEIDISQEIYTDLSSFLKARSSAFLNLNKQKINEEKLYLISSEINLLPFQCQCIEIPINTEISKLEKWKIQAKERPLSGIHLQSLIESADELVVSVKELENLYKLHEKQQIWQKEYVLLQNKINEGNGILQEAKDLLENGRKMLDEIDFGEAFDNLKTKIEKSEIINQKIVKLLEKKMDLSIWSKQLKEIGTIELKSLEIEEFQTKINLCKDINQLLHRKKSNMLSMKEALKMGESLKIDEKLIDELKEKIETGTKLEESATNLLEKGIYFDEEKLEIEEIILKCKTFKIEIKNQKEIKSILKDFQWLDRLYELCSGINATMELEKDLNIPKISIKTQKELCSDLSILLPKIKLIFNDLKTLIIKSSDHRFNDKDIIDFHKNVLKIVWEYELSELMQKMQPESEEIERLFEIGFKENFSNEKLSIWKGLIDNLRLKIDKISDSASELIRKGGLKEEIDIIKKQINELENELDGYDISITPEMSRLIMIKSWLNWETKGLELLSLLKQNKNVDYDRISDILGLANSINFLKDGPIYKSIESLYKVAESFKKRFESLQSKKKDVLTLLRQAKSENSSRKKVLELNKQKPSLEEAETLLKEIEASNQEFIGLELIMKEEILFLKNEISLCNEIEKKLIELKEKFPLNNIEEVRSMSNNDHDTIKKELRVLIQETIWTLGLSIKDWDCLFFIYEMTFQCYYLLAFPQTKSIDYWKNLFNYAEDYNENSVISSEWFIQLKEIFLTAKEILSKIDEIKFSINSLNKEENNVKKFNKEYIEELISKTEKSHVNLMDGKKFLEDLYKKIKNCEENYEKIINNKQKVALPVFIRLKDEIKTLPIVFTNSENIQNQLNIYENLNKYIERSKRYLNVEKLDENLISILLEKYDESAILIVEYEKLKEKYNFSNLTLKEIEEKLNSVITYDEILSIQSKFDEISINLGEKYNQIALKIWQKKLNFYQLMQKSPQNLQINAKQLAHELETGYSFLINPSQSALIISELRFLENLISSIQTKIRDYESIKDKKLLDNIETNLFGFIDLSELLIEYKTALNFNPYARISFDCKNKGFSMVFKENMDVGSFYALLNRLDINPISRNVTDYNKIFEEKTKKNDKFAFLKEKLEENMLGKRKTQSTTFGSDFISKPIQKKTNTNNKIVQNQKKEDFDFDRVIKKTKTEKKSVDESKREETLNKWERQARLNTKFRESQKFKNLRHYLKTIENQIFGNFHHDSLKYDIESQKISRLLEQIIKLPLVSQNILTNNFTIDIIQKLVRNLDRLSEIENNARKKNLEKLKTMEKPKERPMLLGKRPNLPENKEELPIIKKTKTQYDPLGGFSDKKPIKHEAHDPLKEFLIDFPKKTDNQPHPKPLSSLALLTEQKSTLPNPKKKENIPLKKKILEKYETLSSEDEKKSKPKEENSKKEEKKLEFSDDDENNQSDRMYDSQAKRFISDPSETSEDLPLYSEHTTGALPKIPINTAILFDPDNDQQSQIVAKPEKIAKGSILSIYEGKFRLNHAVSIPVNFLTIEELEFIKENFPKITLKEKSNSLKLSGTTDFNSFAEFYFGSHNFKRRVLISGWIEPIGEKYEQHLESFADDLYQTSKVGGYKFGKTSSASFHFLSIKQLNSEYLKKIDFKIRNCGGKNKKPSLLYFLTVKTGLGKLNEPMMEPIVIDIIDESKGNNIINLKEEKKEILNVNTNMIIEKDNKEIIEKNENEMMSPLTNEEEKDDIKEGEKNDEEDIDELLKTIESKQILDFNEPKQELEPKNEDLDLNDILAELQKMGPEELQDFVQSFEPDSRGKIASLLKDYSKEEPKKEEFELKSNVDYRGFPIQNTVIRHEMPGGVFAGPRTTILNKNQFIPHTGVNIGNPRMMGNHQMFHNPYNMPPPHQNFNPGNIIGAQIQYNPMGNFPKNINPIYPGTNNIQNNNKNEK